MNKQQVLYCVTLHCDILEERTWVAHRTHSVLAKSWAHFVSTKVWVHFGIVYAESRSYLSFYDIDPDRKYCDY